MINWNYWKNHCCGSGSGSIGSIYFWASRIRHYLYESESWSFSQQAKNVRKTLILKFFPSFWLYLWRLSDPGPYYNVTDPQHWKNRDLRLHTVHQMLFCFLFTSWRCSRCFSRKFVGLIWRRIVSLFVGERKRLTRIIHGQAFLSLLNTRICQLSTHVVSSFILCWFGLVWEFSHHRRTCVRDRNLRQ